MKVFNLILYEKAEKVYDPVNYILGNRIQQRGTLYILPPTIQDIISLIFM
jgi:hypothetical protein